MESLVHFTNEYALWSILESREFITGSGLNGSYNYDWGINFVGARGKLANHQINDKNCQLICEWNGSYFGPLPYNHLNKIKNAISKLTFDIAFFINLSH